MATANRRRRRDSPPATVSSSGSPVATSYFPPELIPEIARRLTSLPDFFALRAACRAYRAVLPLTASNLASQAPLLLIPRGESQALFHLLDRRRLRFRLSRNRCHDYTEFHSLGGHIAICDDNIDRSCGPKLRIVDLLTGERVPVPSPPTRFLRIILCGDLILAWNRYDCTIQYCRLKAAEWCVASVAEPYFVEDLIYVNGTLYALVSPGYRLAAVGLSDDNDFVGFTFLGGRLDKDERFEYSSAVFSFAECRSELILINAFIFYAREFYVYRWQSEQGRWERIVNLHGCTLFLENNHFAGCLGPNHQGIRGDCIYYTFIGQWCEFSLSDGSYAEHFALGYQNKKPYWPSMPVWVFPSIR